jgi:hypothetical protein
VEAHGRLVIAPKHGEIVVRDILPSELRRVKALPCGWFQGVPLDRVPTNYIAAALRAIPSCPRLEAILRAESYRRGQQHPRCERCRRPAGYPARHGRHLVRLCIACEHVLREGDPNRVC